VGIQDRDYVREADRQRNGRKIDTVEPASPTKRHLAFLVAWLAVMGVLYVAVDTYLTPPKATVTATGDLRIPRARDGHFYIDGSIDGTAVSFLVDTGATMVVVSEDIARRAGLGAGVPTTFRTANGLLAGRTVHGVPVAAGPLSISSMTVGVGLAGNSSERALLGQNFLARFDVAISGQEMVIRRP